MKNDELRDLINNSFDELAPDMFERTLQAVQESVAKEAAATGSISMKNEERTSNIIPIPRHRNTVRGIIAAAVLLFICIPAILLTIKISGPDSAQVANKQTNNGQELANKEQLGKDQDQLTSQNGEPGNDNDSDDKTIAQGIAKSQQNGEKKELNYKENNKKENKNDLIKEEREPSKHPDQEKKENNTTHDNGLPDSKDDQNRSEDSAPHIKNTNKSSQSDGDQTPSRQESGRDHNSKQKTESNNGNKSGSDSDTGRPNKSAYDSSSGRPDKSASDSDTDRPNKSDPGINSDRPKKHDSDKKTDKHKTDEENSVVLIAKVDTDKDSDETPEASVDIGVSQMVTVEACPSDHSDSIKKATAEAKVNLPKSKKRPKIYHDKQLS